MRVLLILFATATSLLLGACGSNVDEPGGAPISAVEEPGGAPISAVVAELAGTSISATELTERIQSGSPPLVLDVRTREEFAEAHIPGAINIPHDELLTRLAELPIKKSDEVVVHCNRGWRAKQAEETLRRSGYSNVRDLAGQWQEWWAARLPTE